MVFDMAHGQWALGIIILYFASLFKQSIRNSEAVWKLYDTLIIQRDNGLKMPEWTNEILDDIRMKEIVERFALLRTENDYMKRIKGGRLATEIVNQLLREKDKSTQKIRIYSAHDSTLVSLMNAFGWIPQTGAEPGYGAALIFELHDGSEACGDLIVKVSDLRINALHRSTIAYFCRKLKQTNIMKINSHPLFTGCILPQLRRKRAHRDIDCRLSTMWTPHPCKLDTFRSKMPNIYITEEQYNQECN